MGLSPSRLRFGGSGNDNLIYGLSQGSPECAFIEPASCSYLTFGCLNASHWNSLYQFSVFAGVDFIFGLSFGIDEAKKTGAAYSWNSTNATALIDYMVRNNQKVWAFELGNELNNPGNIVVSSQVSAFKALAAILAQKMPEALIIGPDTGFNNWQTWISSFLPAAMQSNVPLHAVTHHVYNGINRDTFNSPQRLDIDLSEIVFLSKLVQNGTKAQLWAGENGPTGGGDDGTCGAHSVCGLYASVMWYALRKCDSCKLITIIAVVV